ncbi:MAG: HAD-IA family hydrolase [Acidobacteriota bacterium]|nr:HAD-IA family hydrolase [Acidobacteriota bacterium]
MAEITTFLFDLDGTLIDSIELIMSSFRHTMLTHRGQVPPDEEWRAGFGTPLRPQLARYARSDREVDDMTATYRAHNRQHHDRLVKPYAGIHVMASRLEARGARVGIVTSKNRVATHQGLRHCGLDRFFTVLVPSDDVTDHKPHPAPVREALSRLESRADDTVFIGDSPHDCQSGRAAGVSTAAALWGPFSRESLAQHAPDHWLEHPADVLRLQGERQV